MSADKDREIERLKAIVERQAELLADATAELKAIEDWYAKNRKVFDDGAWVILRARAFLSRVEAVKS